MGAPKLGLLKFLLCIAVTLMAALDLADSELTIQFLQAPPGHSRFPTAIFKYLVTRSNGTNACAKNQCSISCQLDGHTLRSCPDKVIELKNLTVNQKHNFNLSVTTSNGKRNSSSYSWFIDTVPPTATIFTNQNYTNSERVTIDVTFSEACTENGGFKCVNSSSCDVILDGPAYVHASSLRVIKHNIKYSLDIVLSMESIFGRIVVRMADKFCTDKAGNYFTRTNGSIIVLHFDRRPVMVDLWMPVPSYMLEINRVPRTVLATNKMEDLKIFLDFSIPVRNSTEEVLTALHVNSGSILPVVGGNHGNRRFFFELRNVENTEIITIELEAGLVIARTGTPVSPVVPLTILYDSTRPDVWLSTSSPSVTKASDINVVVEFTKPVFGFEPSMVKVKGGKLTRFNGLSRTLYSLTVQAVTQNMVSISIPPGKVSDISGNQNSGSNQVEVNHRMSVSVLDFIKDSTPAISMALHSFVTAGVLATSLAAAALSLSSANLGAVGTLASGSTSTIPCNPSMNLHGLFGHLQVFALSSWLSAYHPIEYSDTIRGLRWLIPRQKLPWKEESTKIWPNHVYLTEERPSSLALGGLYHGEAYHQSYLNLTNSSSEQHQLQFPDEHDINFAWLHRHNMSVKSTPYGLPLNSREYFTYFLRGEPFSATNVVKRMGNYKGWQDLEMNLFWLGIGGGSLLVIHVLILIFLRWRTGTPAHGILSVPRFELLLLILVLPCISQASGFVIQGGTTAGIITGALLLVIPAAFILSIGIFLIVAIFSGSFAQYKEIREVSVSEPRYRKLLWFFIGRPVTGKWFCREGLPASFLPRFGILFENRKGPAMFVYIDQNDQSTIPKWVESGRSGIGRMRAVSSDESTEDSKIPLTRRILGCARSSYIIIDLVRRVGLGLISGLGSSRTAIPSIFALSITLLQFIYLFTLRPYIGRGTHLVETISLLCEAGIFGLTITTFGKNPVKERTLGYIMLTLLFVTLIAQIIMEWYSFTTCLLRFCPYQKKSFSLGLKFAVKGLLLSFLPRKHWLRIVPNSSHPKIGLTPVPPLSPESEFQKRDTDRASHVEPYSAMSATVVPVLSPGSPGLNAMQMSSSVAAEMTVSEQRIEEGKKLKGVKIERQSEMKKLRELAKASFSGDSKFEYTKIPGYEQSSSVGASTSKTRH